MAERSGALRIEGLEKRFGAAHAVDAVDLEIGAGEFFVLLGPSGCGKTTLLRAIAGLERPDRGRILLDGQAIESVPPHQRPVNTVFQHYALFPHLSVAENVAFGLRRRRDRLGDKEIRAKVEAMLARVRLEGFEARAVDQLSGGQRQRVALARALVLEPKVLLLDEPLSALDRSLRLAMQGELKTLQRSSGITFVFVTHDQPEAMALADRIAIMDRGKVVEVAAPAEAYQRPRTAFAARFLGEANLLPARVVEPALLALESESGIGEVKSPADLRPASPGCAPSACRSESGIGEMKSPADLRPASPGCAPWSPLRVPIAHPTSLPAGAAAWCLIRPEWAALGASDGVPVEVLSRTYRGALIEWRVRAASLGRELSVAMASASVDQRSFEPGVQVNLQILRAEALARDEPTPSSEAG